MPLIPDVSSEVLREILSYLDEPLYLGRLACVCRPLRMGIHEDGQLWERVYRSRWAADEQLRYRNEIPDNQMTYYDRYKERHLQDYRLVRTIQGLQGMVSVLVGHHVRVDADLHQYQVLVAIMRRHRRGDRNNADVSRHHPLPQCISSTEQWLAWCVFRSVQLFKSSCDCVELLFSRSDDADHLQAEIDTLERGAIWLSESLMDARDIVEGDYWPCMIGSRVRALLDDLAAQLITPNALLVQRNDQHSMTSASRAGNRIAAELGFSGNSSDYYNEMNSSIAHVLETKNGIPITLAVVFKLLLHRLGYSVDIIGLPGHVVLGVQDSGSIVYLDVFRGCRELSVSDCRNLVASYGVEWSCDMLRPLSASAVLSRMLRNVLTCRVMAFNCNSSSENMDGLFKIRDLQELFQAVLSQHAGGGDESISTYLQRIRQPRESILDGRSIGYFRTLEQPRRRTASF